MLLLVYLSGLDSLLYSFFLCFFFLIEAARNMLKLLKSAVLLFVLFLFLAPYYYGMILCRLVGSAQPVELIMEKGSRFQSDQVEVITVLDLAAMNPHVATVCIVFSSVFLCSLIYVHLSSCFTRMHAL